VARLSLQETEFGGLSDVFQEIAVKCAKRDL
jgi:hypothetical protein